MSTIKVNRIENTATTAGGIDIDSSGRIAVGGTTVTDSNLLNIQGTSASSNIGLVLNDTNTSKIYGIQNGASALKFFDYTASAERFRISSDGKLGVGTSSPLRHLHLAGAGDTGLMLQTTNAVDNNEIWEIQVAGNASNHADLIFRSRTNAGTGGSEAMRIDSSGKLGLGTALPARQLTLFHASQAEIGLLSGADTSGALIYQNASEQKLLIANRESDGHIAFQTGGASERMRLSSGGNLLIGGTTSSAHGNRLLQIGSTSRSATYLELRTSTSGDSGLLFSDGTAGDNSGFRGTVEYNHASDFMQFKTAATERMRISSGGEVLINRTTTTVDSSNFGTRIGGAGTSIGVLVTSRNVGTSSSVAAFFGQNGHLLVMGDGDCENTNNRYTGISDVKLKENIVDANSQWDDIKALQVRNYNFKEETGYGTHTQLGLVAQEVETICPGLVGESNDTDGDLNETGTITKSVAYSVLYMKAVKALQEAQTRIETLETQHATLLARVTALEAA